MNLVEFTMRVQSSSILAVRVATAFDIQNRENILSFQTKYSVKLLHNFFSLLNPAGHGSAAVQVLRELLTQHLPVRQTVRGQVLRRDVPPDPPSGLQVNYMYRIAARTS
jgi:hypothetical protein